MNEAPKTSRRRWLRPAAGLAAIVALPYLWTVWPYRSVADEDAASATRGWDRFLWLNQFAGFTVTLLLIWWWTLTV